MRPMGIGIVGLGQITEVHRDGYRCFGLPTVAGFDVAESARLKFAQQEPAARVYQRLEDLFADPAVEVIDLAAPQFRDARVPAVEMAARYRKPVLIQKPFAHTYADALNMTETLERAGVTAMVNQNLCFAGGVLEAARAMLLEDVIGKPYLGFVFENCCFEPGVNHWFGKGDRWWITNLTVHYLSLLHLLLGPPERVSAVTGRDPAQEGVEAEGFGNMLLHYPKSQYPAGLSVSVYSSGTYLGPPAQVQSPFIQGPEGVINLRAGHGYTLSLRSARDLPVETERHRPVDVRTRWFPEAFGLTMSHLQQSVAAGQTPLCSAGDNLYVMAVCEAAHWSAERRETVRLSEVMKHRYDVDYGAGFLRGYHAWTPPTRLADVPLIRGEKGYAWN